MSKNVKATKKVFTVKENPREFAVNPPKAKETNLARLEFNRTAGELVKAGGVLRNQLQDYIKSKGWSEEKEAKYQEIAESLRKKEIKLAKGGIKFSEAKNTAIEMRKLRQELNVLFAERGSSDVITIESQAENARFQRLLTLCLVYNDGEDAGQPVYKTVDDLLNDIENPVVGQASRHLSEILYKVDSDFEHKLPENKFLLEWGLVNENLQLIKDGKLVDEDGRLIDEEGYYVNEANQRVDRDGNILDKFNNVVVPDSSPFLDDDGNPIAPITKSE